MFYCMLLYVHSSIAIILMGKRELIALLNLSFWFLMMVGRLFLAVPRGCLQFVIVVFPDHTHLLFLHCLRYNNQSYHSGLLSSKKSHGSTHARALIVKHVESSFENSYTVWGCIFKATGGTLRNELDDDVMLRHLKLHSL